MWVGLNEDIRAIHDQPAETDPMREFATGTLIGRPAAPGGARAVPGLPRLARVRLHDRADVHGGRRPGPRLTGARVADTHSHDDITEEP